MLSDHESSNFLDPTILVFVLWGLFGVNIQLFNWLAHRHLLAMLLGATGGPLSYLSVIKLGGASMLKPFPFVFTVIGGVWAIFLPIFLSLNEYLKKIFQDKKQLKKVILNS